MFNGDIHSSGDAKTPDILANEISGDAKTSDFLTHEISGDVKTPERLSA